MDWYKVKKLPSDRVINSDGVLVKKKVGRPRKTETSFGTAFSTTHEKAKQKKVINATLAKHGRRDGRAIVLDGPGINTTKALVAAGWRKDNIFIPNFNEPDFKIIKRKHPQSYCVPLGRFLHDGNPDGNLDRSICPQQHTIGLIYADYMCSWNGNKQCCPERDMEYLFQNKLLMDGSVLGITIALRTAIKNETGFVKPAVEKCISTIQRLAYENGYYAMLHEKGGTYKNGGVMWSGIFTVVQQ